MCYSLVATPVLTYFATPGAHGYPFPEISQYHCTASFSISFYFRLPTTWDDSLPQDLDEQTALKQVSKGLCTMETYSVSAKPFELRLMWVLVAILLQQMHQPVHPHISPR